MSNAINPKPGDVFAIPAYRNGSPTRVTIERVTATQAVDTQGRRWNLKTGIRVGSGNYESIHPWTEADTAAVEEHERAADYRRCLDALGASAFCWQRLPTGDALARALPHLEAAVAALPAADATVEV